MQFRSEEKSGEKGYMYLFIVFILLLGLPCGVRNGRRLNAIPLLYQGYIDVPRIANV